MRIAIACERKAKVKCNHSGQAPCAGCLKSGKTESCVLSGPLLSSGRQVQVKKRGSEDAGSNDSRASKRSRSSVHDVDAGNQDKDKAVQPVAPNGHGTRVLFNRIPGHRFIEALSIFKSKFSEFSLIHPNDYDRAQSSPNPVQKLRLLAIYAVSSRYMSSANTAEAAAAAAAAATGTGTATAPSSRDCAAHVAGELQRRITNAPPPSAATHLIQTYLVMALHDWGEGEGFSAWMYAGIAFRMVYGAVPITALVNGDSGSGALAGEDSRIVWSCFALDKLLSCGRHRPSMFRLDEMDIPLPASEEEFVFGHPLVQEAPCSDAMSINSSSSNSQARLGISQYFRIVVQGLDIWSRIHGWAARGGRRLPGMTEPHNSPWREGAPWARMMKDLMLWRDSQDTRIKYPDVAVSAHAHLGHGEMFGFINLIYYISLLYLSREYLPFLPIGQTQFRGPIDPPFLKETAPEGFWQSHCDDTFRAAAQISDLMRDLRNANAPLHTPFTGLCAFSAAFMNQHAVAFPLFVGQTVSEKAVNRALESGEDLQRIRKLWKIGEEWYSMFESVKAMFSHVLTSNVGTNPQRMSRDDFAELADLFQLARLKGMPRPVFSFSDSRERDTGLVNRTEESELSISVLTECQTWSPSAFPREIVGTVGTEEWWDSWSFWDGSHISAMNESDVSREAVLY